MLNTAKKIASSCSCGSVHKMATDKVYVGKNASSELNEFAKDYKSVLIVCDANTEKYTSLLSDFEKIILPGNSHANEKGVEPLIKRLEEKEYDLLIACGSGSLHDITRYSANEKNIPFVSFPTAASVDGFVSTVAAMTWGGQKLSSPAAAPIALFADEDVFSDAPARLTASGVSDILGKFTALCDWKIAKILTGEKICPEIFGLMEKALEKLEALLERKAAGEFDDNSKEYTGAVMESLVLAGLSMQLQGNSRPASGSEHHLSHLWEMHVINEPTSALHGEQVGVASLILSKFYHENEGFDFTKVPNFKETFDHSYVENAFGELTDGILAENLDNNDVTTSPLNFKATKEQSDRANKEIAALISPEKLERYLKIAGAPSTMQELGLPSDKEFICKTLAYAPYVRKRLSLLKIISAKY